MQEKQLSMILDIAIIKIQNKEVMQKKDIMQLRHHLQPKARLILYKSKKIKL
jgi:hypothetical protein